MSELGWTVAEGSLSVAILVPMVQPRLLVGLSMRRNDVETGLWDSRQRELDHKFVRRGLRLMRLMH